MEKNAVIPLTSAEKIISDAKRFLSLFKNDKKKEFKAFKEALKTRPHYKKSKLYQKFKPYITGEKRIEVLRKEDFIKENQVDVEREEMRKKMEATVERKNYSH